MNVPYTYRETLLKIEGVTVEYEGRVILRDVSGEIRDVYVPDRITGQIVAVLGPSGCGKSTLFRILSGLEKPKSGQVLIANEKGFNPVYAGEVGVVAQSYPLFMHRSVYGNLMLPARAHHPDVEARQVVEEGLRRFDLWDKKDLYPAKLSGGQRQRVAILQMLICRESVILMDEPFSGLDLIRLEQAIEAISAAANLAEQNTFIIVSHDVTACIAIADHIWLLGHEYDSQGKQIEGCRIVETYDLLAEGLCYEPGMVTSEGAMKMVKRIKERFRSL